MIIQYKLLKSFTNKEICCVTIIGENISIPFDPANQDFVEYQKWLSEGNSPLPADEPTLP